MKKITWILLGIVLTIAVCASTLHIKYDQNAAGWYSWDEKTVILFMDKIPSFDEYMQIARHEYAHYYFREKMTISQRKIYRNIYLDSTSFVSEYAKDCTQYNVTCIDYEEDFAESFAHHTYLGERAEFFSQFVHIE